MLGSGPPDQNPRQNFCAWFFWWALSSQRGYRDFTGPCSQTLWWFSKMKRARTKNTEKIRWSWSWGSCEALLLTCCWPSWGSRGASRHHWPRRCRSRIWKETVRLSLLLDTMLEFWFRPACRPTEKGPLSVEPVWEPWDLGTLFQN